jgi:hypothetical protein
MKKLVNTTSLIVLLGFVLVASSIPTFADEIIRSRYQPTIGEKLNDLIALEEYNEVGNIEFGNLQGKLRDQGRNKNKKTRFNKNKAIKYSKIARSSIHLKEALSRYNNTMIETTQNGRNIFDESIDKMFPEVVDFFNELESFDLNYQVDLSNTSSVKLIGSIEALANRFMKHRRGQRAATFIIQSQEHLRQNLLAGIEIPKKHYLAGATTELQIM